MPVMPELPKHILPLFEKFCADREKLAFDNGYARGKADGASEVMNGLRTISAFLPTNQPQVWPQLSPPVMLSEKPQKPVESEPDFDISDLLQDVFGDDWDEEDKDALIQLAMVSVQEAYKSKGKDASAILNRLRMLADDDEMFSDVMSGKQNLAWQRVDYTDGRKRKYQFKAVDDVTNKVKYGAAAQAVLAREGARGNKTNFEGKITAKAGNQDWETFDSDLESLTLRELKDLREKLSKTFVVDGDKRKKDTWVAALKTLITEVMKDATKPESKAEVEPKSESRPTNDDEDAYIKEDLSKQKMPFPIETKFYLPGDTSVVERDIYDLALRGKTKTGDKIGVPPLVDVPLDNLTATQDWLIQKSLDYVSEQSKAGDPPVIVKIGDKLYISDGHHRAVAAKNAGKSTVPAKVVEYDPETDSISPITSLGKPAPKSEPVADVVSEQEEPDFAPASETAMDKYGVDESTLDKSVDKILKSVMAKKPATKAKRKEGQKSIASIVQSSGGIDPQDSAFLAQFGSAREALTDYGIPMSVFKKGGNGFDTLARSLASEGHFQVGDNDDGTEKLAELLKKKAISDLHNDASEYDYEDQERDAIRGSIEKELKGKLAEFKDEITADPEFLDAIVSSLASDADFNSYEIANAKLDDKRQVDDEDDYGLADLQSSEQPAPEPVKQEESATPAKPKGLTARERMTYPDKRSVENMLRKEQKVPDHVLEHYGLGKKETPVELPATPDAVKRELKASAEGKRQASTEGISGESERQKKKRLQRQKVEKALGDVIGTDNLDDEMIDIIAKSSDMSREDVVKIKDEISDIRIEDALAKAHDQEKKGGDSIKETFFDDLASRYGVNAEELVKKYDKLKRGVKTKEIKALKTPADSSVEDKAELDKFETGTFVGDDESPEMERLAREKAGLVDPESDTMKAIEDKPGGLTPEQRDRRKKFLEDNLKAQSIVSDAETAKLSDKVKSTIRTIDSLDMTDSETYREKVLDELAKLSGPERNKLATALKLPGTSKKIGETDEGQVPRPITMDAIADAIVKQNEKRGKRGKADTVTTEADSVPGVTPEATKEIVDSVSEAFSSVFPDSSPTNDPNEPNGQYGATLGDRRIVAHYDPELGAAKIDFFNAGEWLDPGSNPEEELKIPKDLRSGSLELIKRIQKFASIIKSKGIPLAYVADDRHHQSYARGLLRAGFIPDGEPIVSDEYGDDNLIYKWKPSPTNSTNQTKMVDGSTTPTQVEPAASTPSDAPAKPSKASGESDYGIKTAFQSVKPNDPKSILSSLESLKESVDKSGDPELARVMKVVDSRLHRLRGFAELGGTGKGYREAIKGTVGSIVDVLDDVHKEGNQKQIEFATNLLRSIPGVEEISQSGAYETGIHTPIDNATPGQPIEVVRPGFRWSDGKGFNPLISPAIVRKASSGSDATPTTETKKVKKDAAKTGNKKTFDISTLAGAYDLYSDRLYIGDIPDRKSAEVVAKILRGDTSAAKWMEDDPDSLPEIRELIGTRPDATAEKVLEEITADLRSKSDGSNLGTYDEWQAFVRGNYVGKPMSEKVRDSFGGYKGELYDPINQFLRTGDMGLGKATDEDRANIEQMVPEAIKDLDEGFRKHSVELPNPIGVTRFLTTGTPLGKALLEQLRSGKIKAGDEITDNAYVSTSFGIGSKVSGSTGKPEIRLNINLPKGSRVMPEIAFSAASNEREVLLPRGAKFKVRSVKNVDGHSVVDLDYEGSSTQTETKKVKSKKRT